MDDLLQKAQVLEKELGAIRNQLNIDKRLEKLARLKEQSQDPDFWTDSERAQKVSKQISRLSSETEPWETVKSEISEILEFLKMNDESLEGEVSEKLQKLTAKSENLKAELKFSGPHDGDDAVVVIQSGAGGTDAQDWTEMLKRMYLRWAKRSDIKVQELSESAGEEAGIKNTSLLMSGTKAYGKMRSEHGVHRLVRLSPYNSANSRETSFAMVEVTPQIDEPESIEINEEDLKIDVYRSGGKGGQSVNTTDSAVRVTHLPTAVTVAIQNERSQIQNKATAISVLKSKLAQLAEEQHAEKIAELKGPNVEAAWGNQIRSYVLHPYTLVKDSRTSHETANVQAVLDGEEQLDEFMNSFLEKTISDSED